MLQQVEIQLIKLTLISKLEMVQRKSIHWVCCNLINDVSVTKLRHSLGMKTLENRCSVGQLKMFHDIIDNTKQVRKDILPVHQSVALTLYLNHCLVLLNHIYFFFLPTSSKTMQQFTKRH